MAAVNGWVLFKQYSISGDPSSTLMPRIMALAALHVVCAAAMISGKTSVVYDSNGTKWLKASRNNASFFMHVDATFIVGARIAPSPHKLRMSAEPSLSPVCVRLATSSRDMG